MGNLTRNWTSAGRTRKLRDSRGRVTSGISAHMLMFMHTCTALVQGL
jgi:hypothetical protein